MFQNNLQRYVYLKKKNSETLTIKTNEMMIYSGNQGDVLKNTFVSLPVTTENYRQSLWFPITHFLQYNVGILKMLTHLLSLL